MGKVKWDSAADQILLTKILETHEMSVDVARVAEAWPGDDKPTPRAIKERITKIKEIRKKASTGVGGITSPTTPKKRATSRKKTNEDTPTKKQKSSAKVTPKYFMTTEETASEIKVQADDPVTAAKPVKEEDSQIKVKKEMTRAEADALFDYPIPVKNEPLGDTPPRFEGLRETSKDPYLSQQATEDDDSNSDSW